MKKFIWTIVVVFFMVGTLTAQDDELAPVVRTIAFTNVNIVPEPGQLIENGIVVVDNGVITAVGRNASIPPGSQIIKADSMYLYYGFILGMSHAGIKMPKQEGRPDVKVPGNPPDDVAGITPERTIHDYLSSGEKSISDLRGVGFTMAQVAPEGGMLPGKASLVVFKGNTADEMILKPSTMQYATFDGAPRVYPATIIGVMAKFRELYRQAEQAQRMIRMYENDPGGLERPGYDETLEALYPVVNKNISVAFKGEEVLNAQRAMLLKKDLGFDLILTELKEGWDLIQPIKQHNAKVLFSMDLPEWEEEKKDSTKEDTSSEEKKMLEKRKEVYAKKYFSQMAMFKNAGIPFAFSSIDVKPQDIHKNLVKMVEYGLSPEDALAALTTTPASMFNLGKFAGTVSTGKMANLVISTEPYFTKDAKVKYVMVDGHLYEMSVKEKKKADPEAAANAPGTWSYTSETSMGTITGVIKIQERDGQLSGTITSSMSEETYDLQDLTISGNNMSFNYTVNMGGQSIDVNTVVNLEGNTFEGTISAAGTSFPVEGSKEPELN